MGVGLVVLGSQLLGRSTLLLAMSVVLGVSLVVPSRAVGQEGSSVADIAKRSAAFDSAFNVADLEGLAALVTDDVAFASAAGSGPPGAQAFLADVREMLADRPGLRSSHIPEAITVGTAGWGVASERGRWIESWLQDGTEVTLTGTYLTLWRHEQGEWRKASELLIALECSGPYC